MENAFFSNAKFRTNLLERWVTIFLIGMALLLPACQTGNNLRVSTTSTVNQQLGIEVIAIRRSADGYMLDFRYRVLDGSRAAVMTDHKVKPYLVHEATGARFAIPSSAKVGPLRQTQRNALPQEGRVYFMMFANPGRYTQAGDLVTVIVGDVRIEHLVVE